MTRGQHLRAQLAARDGWACCYCGRPTVERRGEDDDRATIEHVIPQSRGGTDSLDNLRIACRRCNWARGDKELRVDPALAVLCPRCCAKPGRPCISVRTTRPKRQTHPARLREANGRNR